MTIAPAKSKFTENLERKETNASAAKSWIGNYTSDRPNLLKNR